MDAGALIALALVLVAWAALSEWLAARNLTGPLVLAAAGTLLGNASWGIVEVDVDSGAIHLLAEGTLGLLLFSDATGVTLRKARFDLPLTVRLLAIGLPLCIALGTGLAAVAFPAMPLALAALVAASLAPTDAALSASVIADERVPERIRRVLNVESGLNDGIATPIVTFCIAATATALGIAGGSHADGAGALAELLVGVVVGAATGAIGGAVLTGSRRRGWMQHGARRMMALGLAAISFLVTQEVGGNPFVAAFVGGLAFRAAARDDATEAAELIELGSGLLAHALWFVFGAAFVLPAFEDLDLRIALYALASLTVIRMVPVGVALLGSGQSRATVLFVGWFGPRGLASVIFALLAVEELGVADPLTETATKVIAVVVVASVVLHGATGRPLSARYAAAEAGIPPTVAPAADRG